MCYATDVSDEEWNLISGYFTASKVGAPRKHNIRHVFNALIYILRTGCQWRLLPNDFRKRHILVGVTGHILSASIHSAQIHDSKGGRLLLEQSLSKGNMSRMILIFADEAYSGDLQEWIQRVTKLKTRIRISKKPNVKGFVPIF